MQGELSTINYQLSISPKTLILATSHAPELPAAHLRPRVYPRTDYVELAKARGCDIVDYAIYDRPGIASGLRSLEKHARLDFNLALVGLRRARQYDVVLLMSERVAIPYMMLQKITGRRSRAVYVSAHSSAKQAGLIISMGLFNWVDIVVSNTHAQRDFLVSEMRVPEQRIRYVLYAIDEQFFVPPDASSRPTTNAGSGDYIFSAGGIRGRDYETLFEAARGLGMRVKIAAGGRAYGPSARRKLPPLPENVELLPPTDSSGMKELYQRAAAVVVPLSGGRKDAAGCSVVLEGMACGKPVIATHTPGMEDYITDGRTGILADSRRRPRVAERCPIDAGLAGEIPRAWGEGQDQSEDRLSLRDSCGWVGKQHSRRLRWR